MIEYLLLEDIDIWLQAMDNIANTSVDARFGELNAQCAATLRAYAKVVEAVANAKPLQETRSRKGFELRIDISESDYLLARELRGHDQG